MSRRPKAVHAGADDSQLRRKGQRLLRSAESREQPRSPEGEHPSVLLAGGLITDRQGRLLLLHRSTPGLTQWEIPGGKVEPFESLSHAAERELAEELGVRVRLLGEVGRCDFVQHDRWHHYVWFNTEVISGTPAIAETRTFDRFDYFTWQQLQTLNGEASPSLECLIDLLRQRGQQPREIVAR